LTESPRPCPNQSIALQLCLAAAVWQTLMLDARSWLG
jgi:hypothetical protein